MRRIVPASTLKGTDGGQWRVSPPIRDKTVAELRANNERSMPKYRDESFDGMQWLLVRPIV